VLSELLVLVDFSQLHLQPETILERRLVKKGNDVVLQVCIKWQGLLEASTTWKDWYVLISKLPTVASWGQDGASVGGGVTPVG
jgi:hypothetical protein